MDFNDITFFKTSQGSKYIRMSDGRLRRWKSYHSNTGGEDQGLHSWSDMSVFVDPQYDREANSPQFLIDKGYKIGLSKTKNGKMVVVIFDVDNWRPATWGDAYPVFVGRNPEYKDKPLAWEYVKEPKVGYHVVDFKFKDGQLKSYHFGSDVSEIGEFSDDDKKLFFPSYFKDNNLQEQITRIKQVMGLLSEDDDKVDNRVYDYEEGRNEVPNRLPFDINKLIDAGAVFVTPAIDGDPDSETYKEWLNEPYTHLITLYNVEHSDEDGWVRKAITKKASVVDWRDDFVNKLYDGKYNQILWSLEKLGVNPKDMLIKGMMETLSEDDDKEEKRFINNTEKYNEFKKRWIPSHGEGNLDIESPFEFKIFLFPEEKGFYLELYYNNVIVGNFHSYVDDEEGMMNDTMILPNFRNKGLGKILLVKAMDVAYSYLGGFEPDRRGVMGQQGNVYASLIKNDIISNNYDINYDKAQDMINSIVENF